MLLEPYLPDPELPERNKMMSNNFYSLADGSYPSTETALYINLHEIRMPAWNLSYIFVFYQ